MSDLDNHIIVPEKEVAIIRSVISRLTDDGIRGSLGVSRYPSSRMPER